MNILELIYFIALGLTENREDVKKYIKDLVHSEIFFNYIITNLGYFLIIESEK